MVEAETRTSQASFQIFQVSFEALTRMRLEQSENESEASTPSLIVFLTHLYYNLYSCIASGLFKTAILFALEYSKTICKLIHISEQTKYFYICTHLTYISRFLNKCSILLYYKMFHLGSIEFNMNLAGFAKTK